MATTSSRSFLQNIGVGRLFIGLSLLGVVVCGILVSFTNTEGLNVNQQSNTRYVTEDDLKFLRKDFDRLVLNQEQLQKDLMRSIEDLVVLQQRTQALDERYNASHEQLKKDLSLNVDGLGALQKHLLILDECHNDSIVKYSELLNYVSTLSPPTALSVLGHDTPPTPSRAPAPSQFHASSATKSGARRSSFPASAPMAIPNCTAKTAEVQAGAFYSEFLARGGMGCGTNDWMFLLRDSDFKSATPDTHTHRVIINVGANKGYLAATILGLWLPQSGSSPTDLRAFLDTRPEVGEKKCGVCSDCDAKLPAAPVDTRSGVSISVEVHAIEPQPSNFALLTGYAALLKSRGYGDSFIPYNYGISSADGVGEFEERGAGDEGSSLGNKNRGSDKLVPVRLKSIDSFVKAHVDPSESTIIDILYMDTEGYDPAALAGAEATLSYTRVVVFEYHDLGMWQDTTLKATVAALDVMHGFDCYHLRSVSDKTTGKERGTLVLLTGGCWSRLYEFRQWSNVLCVNRRDARWATAMRSLAYLLPRDSN
jgi:FkbM family methyltransferase